MHTVCTLNILSHMRPQKAGSEKDQCGHGKEKKQLNFKNSVTLYFSLQF